MMGRPGIQTLACLAIAFAAMAVVAAPALAHGGDEMAVEDLAQQPARTLAQQALAELQINGNTDEAAVRLDAAVSSSDQAGVDRALVDQAMEMVDSGNPAGAIPLLDSALSKPLGSAQGAALHESGREFQPGTDTQEVVAIVLGALLLLLGAVSLRPRRSEP
jgi:hypothetical protein